MILEKSWGLIKEYTLNQMSTVKMIVVSTGKSTSLHYHNLRDDMWVILDDGLEVQVGEQVYHPNAGDEFVIHAGTKHSISAADKPGRVLEIDFGFTTEDDVFHSEEREEESGNEANE
jgi:mannose-6-phosphate isomerase-like protein (cupin superfamily)